ncbi:carbonate dehydratase [Fodinicurvata fenggangensis]|uniref:carbonate dehydratase n=1 Tax=Fodinicurvata fenggangensis TaxID=1121830 RepID=UPI001FDF50F6|nr:carbonate dehydratase [Fodinicurvata fenggangensis]
MVSQAGQGVMISQLIENNRRWAEERSRQDPDYFPRLSRQQAPEYLWIGCADSRVPANEIVNLDPGELFVHRNVANLVVSSDLNCLSVLQFAVEVLKVRHVIVCGHYGCGGVRAAMEKKQFGLIDNWLWPLRSLHARHQEELQNLNNEDARVDRLCELNVMSQALNVARTPIIQNAWHRRQSVKVHSWIYGLKNGLVTDLGVSFDGQERLPEADRLDPA